MQSMLQFRWGALLTFLTAFAACTNNDIDPSLGSGGTPSKGSADFTRYVAVGNSLTAGYADGGVYRESQLNSYPNILAGQFKTVGGGDFIQPLFTEAQANGSGYIRLRKLPASATSLPTFDTTKTQLAVRGLTSNGTPLYTLFTDANQNLGVPAIKVADIRTAGYGSSMGNPYFERLVTNKAATYLQYVSSNLNGATFFSCWLGNNDALLYAVSGGMGAENTSNGLTSTALFTTNFTAAMDTLTKGSRKGVVVSIPNIVQAPYFTTVTAQVNALVASQGRTGLAIQTKNGVRLSTAGDYFLLSVAPFFNTFLAQGVGLSAANPVPDRFVLDASEVQTLNTRIGEFNAIMKSQADAKGAAFVDINSIFQQITQSGGYVQNGITYTAAYIQGGAFSLDGIHLTPAGYALIANEIIKGINSKYSSTVPQVNPANYRRVLLQ
ncbi:SGNH/GDSL hydrolase family protein [Spirosoma sp. KUDC1026]|uniref:SGNH/GDSL hydrolase family protein n=1 Tax=Spirosoma sp. KUDC1026 TaxID=2745947 RepID=UPI00159B952A|nr:SGNH/GDSL hydrolase family protein [Spirosoma sp. KUDC1026]QKZ14590.1 SGNH/GDSL hydrolase family protein [Spirosoma sp. KUDC1026]